MNRRIAILGSTGSIGSNAIDVIQRLGDPIDVVGIGARSNAETLARQAAALDCRWCYLADSQHLQRLRQLAPDSCSTFSEPERLCDALCSDDIDMVLCAIVGTAGLAPVLAAIRAGKDIALASKEVLVMAGERVMTEARQHGVKILPVDSEHCAIFQCLQGEKRGDVRRLIITASGGPFRDKPDLDLDTVTPEQALDHPTWDMGRKISIDSATLMNKALEVIEARWLFDVCPKQIDTVVHPQSIIHSMVEFTDGSILAQLGYPDMRLPIQYCLTYPQRLASPQKPLDLTQMLDLHFEPPQHERFPSIKLAHYALKQGGTHPAALNAANEVAVQAFLERKLPFSAIPKVVEQVLERHPERTAPTLEGILDDDALARREAQRAVRASRQRPS